MYGSSSVLRVQVSISRSKWMDALHPEPLAGITIEHDHLVSVWPRHNGLPAHLEPKLESLHVLGGRLEPFAPIVKATALMLVPRVL